MLDMYLLSYIFIPYLIFLILLCQKDFQYRSSTVCTASALCLHCPRVAVSYIARIYNCERSELSSEFNGTYFLSIYIGIFQAVRRAVNEMFETPDTVFNNLELLVNPSSTAKKCSATEDCCRNPGGDRHPSSTVKYCSATGLLPNRQRGERPGVNGLPFSHRRKETARLQQVTTAR